MINLTKDKTDRLFDGGLVGELGLKQLGREKVPELAGLVPTNVLVVNIHLPQSPHHRQLEILVVHRLVSSCRNSNSIERTEINFISTNKYPTDTVALIFCLVK